jgi:hypothetical protein
LIPQGLQDLAIQLITVAPVAAEAATGSIQAGSYGEVMGFAKGSTHRADFPKGAVYGSTNFTYNFHLT